MADQWLADDEWCAAMDEECEASLKRMDIVIDAIRARLLQLVPPDEEKRSISSPVNLETSAILASESMVFDLHHLRSVVDYIDMLEDMTDMKPSKAAAVVDKINNQIRGVSDVVQEINEVLKPQVPVYDTTRAKRFSRDPAAALELITNWLTANLSGRIGDITKGTGLWYATVQYAISKNPGVFDKTRTKLPGAPYLITLKSMPGQEVQPVGPKKRRKDVLVHIITWLTNNPGKHRIRTIARGLKEAFEDVKYAIDSNRESFVIERSTVVQGRPFLISLKMCDCPTCDDTPDLTDRGLLAQKVADDINQMLDEAERNSEVHDGTPVQDAQGEGSDQETQPGEQGCGGAID